MFTKAHCRTDTDKPLYRAGNRSFDQDIRALENTIVQETAGRCDLAGIIADLQNPLVKLGALLVSQLAHLGNLPPDMVGVPGSEGTDMAFLSANGVFTFAQCNTPALYGTIAFPCRW